MSLVAPITNRCAAANSKTFTKMRIVAERALFHMLIDRVMKPLAHVLWIVMASHAGIEQLFHKQTLDGAAVRLMTLVASAPLYRRMTDFVRKISRVTILTRCQIVLPNVHAMIHIMTDCTAPIRHRLMDKQRFPLCCMRRRHIHPLVH